MIPSTGDRVASNATLLLVSRVLSRAVGLAVILLVTRLLGAGDFGKLSFALSFAGLFAVVVGGGLTPLLTREIARDRQRAGEYLASTLVLKVGLLGLASVALAVAAGLWVHDPAGRRAVGLAAVSLFALSFTSVVDGVFRAFERMQYEVWAFVAGKVALLALAVLCFLRRASLDGVMAAFAAASLVELLLSAWLLRTRLVRCGWVVRRALALRILRLSIPFALSAVLGVVYFRIDTVMLGFLRGDVETGWYGGAYRFVEAVVFVPEMMAAALFPVLARKFFAGEPLAGVFARSFRVFVTLGLPFALGATLLPRVARILGGGFGGSETVLPYLGWTLFLLFLNYLFVTTLNASERQVWVTVALGCGAVANVLLNLAFIPRWGCVGAGIATLVSTGLVCMAELWAIVRLMGGPGVFSGAWKTLTAGAGLAIFWYALRGANLGWLVPAGGVLYVGLLVLVRGMPAEDLRLLKGALGSARAQAADL
jgi:O-antigen/teichoic acid export membrane protein